MLDKVIFEMFTAPKSIAPFKITDQEVGKILIKKCFLVSSSIGPEPVKFILNYTQTLM